jgi:cyclase
MARIRVIPVLLLKKGGLYKSVKFRDHKYVGDPINAVKIFNEKEVDELVILDTDATKEGRAPNIKQISEIAGEAFMPVGYGGGITSIEQAKRILFEGIEKVVFNTSAIGDPDLISEAARQFGSSSVVVSIDVKKDWLGRYKAFSKSGSVNTGMDPLQLARRMQESGAGEIFLTSIDRDGTYTGYDLALVKSIAGKLSIPVIICGGASSVEDFKPAIDSGASAVAAGSMFVFQRPHNAVLINYPSQQELKGKLYSLIQ